MRGSTRKGLFGVFIAAATVLVLASAAFACTTYKGRFTIGTSTAIGANGTNPNGGMRYCNDVVPPRVDISRSGFSASVAAEKSACLVSGYNRLPYQNTSGVAYTYWIDYQPGTATYGDCMHGSSGNQTVGKMPVSNDAERQGSGTYPQAGYTWSPVLGNGDVCVSDTNYYYGNQLLVKVV